MTADLLFGEPDRSERDGDYTDTDMPDRTARQRERLRQLEERLAATGKVHWTIPAGGWIASVRDALGMSGEQLGKRLGITRSSVKALELREVRGGVTVEALRDAAAAMGGELEYRFVPKNGNFESVLKAQAELIAGGDRSLDGSQSARDARIIDLVEQRPRDLWDPVAPGEPTTREARRKGRRPGGSKPRKSASTPNPSLANAPTRAPVQGSLAAAYEHALEAVRAAKRRSEGHSAGVPAVSAPSAPRAHTLPTSGTSNGNPSVPSTSQPLKDGSRPAESRQRSRGSRDEGDAGQLDVFG